MDEVNFAQGASIDYNKSKIMSTYRSIKRRMQSRFTRNGILAAKLFLVSSKKSEQDFIESYIETVKNEPTVYIVDEPQWNVKPEGTFSKKRFQVAVGDKKLHSKVVVDGESLDGLKAQGYKIIDVPLELKRDFERDVDMALMEFAGISTTLVTKFIAYDNLANAYCDTPNPFTNNVLSIGTKDDLQIQDFFLPELIDEKFYSKPLFIHIDASITGDRTGIAGVWAIGLREEYQYVEGDYVPMQELVYKHAFSVAIECPSGAEISLEKNRKFIYYLRYKLGMNIVSVSMDGFQSRDTLQQISQAGFDTQLISLDKTPDGYMYLKASINEKRIAMLEIPELEKELINLEQNNMTGKVDHPVNGRKDQSDAVCGALFNASKNADISTMYVVEDFKSISEANDDVVNADIVTTVQNSLTKGLIKDNISISEKINSVMDLVQKEREEELRQNSRLNDFKSRLTQSERNNVTDEELEDAFFSRRDDDILIF
jgi:hypothetical protein